MVDHDAWMQSLLSRLDDAEGQLSSQTDGNLVEPPPQARKERSRSPRRRSRFDIVGDQPGALTTPASVSAPSGGDKGSAPIIGEADIAEAVRRAAAVRSSNAAASYPPIVEQNTRDGSGPPGNKPPGSRVCVHFLKGDCSFGDNCANMHPVSEAEVVNWTSTFLSRMCQHGNKCSTRGCLYGHPEQSPGEPPPGGWSPGPAMMVSVALKNKWNTVTESGTLFNNTAFEMPGGQSSEDNRVDRFISANNIDERAGNCLKQLPFDLQSKVLSEGPVWGANPSAGLMARINRMQAQMKADGGITPSWAAPRLVFNEPPSAPRLVFNETPSIQGGMTPSWAAPRLQQEQMPPGLGAQFSSGVSSGPAEAAEGELTAGWMRAPGAPPLVPKPAFGTPKSAFPHPEYDPAGGARNRGSLFGRRIGGALTAEQIENMSEPELRQKIQERVGRNSPFYRDRNDAIRVLKRLENV